MYWRLKPVYGIDDLQILSEIMLTIGFALACIIYGIIFWNRDTNE